MPGAARFGDKGKDTHRVKGTVQTDSYHPFLKCASPPYLGKFKNDIAQIDIMVTLNNQNYTDFYDQKSKFTYYDATVAKVPAPRPAPGCTATEPPYNRKQALLLLAAAVAVPLRSLGTAAQVEELRHIILQHVSEEHRERALLLLKTVEQRR